ncbi:hypothetical protein [Anaerocolumna xylanovorans]|uniref:Uncharacterized protein n=1 Tax=Anaerocolumna xylanovorans DSM 12503 TaxID=1121345 RepID=A0A1M7YLU3_9FIRM|nr:hypothetical protein [Anaerocolumna xylanovorans]SHO53580.1 hypothetical protein SAMN02745217_04171 [Anaerocolumna xylanovorans DSM 12503]
MILEKIQAEENFTEADIEQALENITLMGSCCTRIGGIKICIYDDKTEILAWQCNMADVQDFDVKLPTIISIEINKDNKIEKINLYKKFKGSQGIACTGKYLNRRMRQILLGEVFTPNNPVIKDSLILFCRHIYELVYGSCTFLEYCKKKEMTKGLVQEITQAFSTETGLECVDRIIVNGKESITKIDINNLIRNVKYNKQGKIVHAENIEIIGYEWILDGQWKEIRSLQVLEANSNSEYVMKLMKIISAYWIKSGKNIEIKEKFYFSQIWGPTFYGILSQAIGLVMFNKNYAYFQHCIYGIQHTDDGRPLCIGVVDNISEAEKYFEGFTVDDLY